MRRLSFQIPCHSKTASQQLPSGDTGVGLLKHQPTYRGRAAPGIPLPSVAPAWPSPAKSDSRSGPPLRHTSRGTSAPPAASPYLHHQGRPAAPSTPHTPSRGSFRSPKGCTSAITRHPCARRLPGYFGFHLAYRSSFCLRTAADRAATPTRGHVACHISPIFTLGTDRLCESRPNRSGPICRPPPDPPSPDVCAVSHRRCAESRTASPATGNQDEITGSIPGPANSSG